MIEQVETNNIIACKREIADA